MSLKRLAARLLASVCVFALAACGGGGGGDAPTTNVTDPGGTSGETTGGSTTPSFSFAPPAPATLGNNTTAPPTVGQPLSGTDNPLKQSVIAITSNSIGPDTVANSGGATLTIVNWNMSGGSQFRLRIPGLGVDQTFTSATLFQSPTTVTASAFQLTDANMSYTALGLWEVDTSSPSLTVHLGAYVTGYETPANAMPTTGTATYSGPGGVSGIVVSGTSSGTFTASLSGSASFNVNFGSGLVTGALTNMSAIQGNNIGLPWNDVSVTATIAGGTSHFSGSTSVTSTPTGPFAVSNAATGHIDGGFYGPHAEELGAVWSLGDASKSIAAIGVVGAWIPSGGDGGSGGSSSGGSSLVGIWAGTSNPGGAVGVSIGGSH